MVSINSAICLKIVCTIAEYVFFYGNKLFIDVLTTNYQNNTFGILAVRLLDHIAIYAIQLIVLEPSLAIRWINEDISVKILTMKLRYMYS